MIIRLALASAIILISAIATPSTAVHDYNLTPIPSAIADAIAEGLEVDDPMNPDDCLTDGTMIICPDGKVIDMP